MDTIKAKFRYITQREDTSLQREDLNNRLSEIGQPGKVLKAFDIFLGAQKQHTANVKLAIGIGLTSAAVIFSVVQAARDTSKNCAPGTDGTTKLDCGISTGSIISAALGVGGAVTSGSQLWDGRAHVDVIRVSMDVELERKLHRDPSNAAVANNLGKSLVSLFAALTVEDQNRIRKALILATPEPAPPHVA